MSNFAEQTIRATLASLQERRQKLQAFLDEAADLDVAIREQEGAVERYLRKRPAVATQRDVERDEDVTRRLEAITGGAKPALDPDPSRPPRPRSAPAALPRPEGPTNKQRALAALRENPRGLSTTAVMNAADIAPGSISVTLSQLEGDGLIEKVGRGFWKPIIEEPAVA